MFNGKGSMNVTKQVMGVKGIFSFCSAQLDIQCTRDITTSKGTEKIMSDVAKIVIPGVHCIY